MTEPGVTERPEGPPFDIDDFLAQPLVARVATAAPSVRPVWYLWENGSFWWITGSHSRISEMIEQDARVAIVVDSCDVATGSVRQVTAVGVARLHPLDRERAVRKLTRYLGPDRSRWDGRFLEALYEDASTGLVELRPTTMHAHDYSFLPSV